MAVNTIIAWTDHTHNIAWGCTKISPGCAHCYADTLSSRYGHDIWGASKPRRILSDANWAKPIEWNEQARAEGRQHRVFCSSMCDVWEDHPTITTQRARLWPLIERTPFLDWQLLTKRPERIAANLPPTWGDGWPNVWLGTSIESNDYTHRAEHLRRIPAVVRFVSYEPALGPLDRLELEGIDWLICGGESGPGYRAMPHEWPRQMRALCEASGVAFFFKQSAAARTEMGTTLDGETVRKYPVPRAVCPPSFTLA